MNVHGGDLAKIAWPTLIRHVGHELDCVIYADSTHRCDNCEGVDPISCVFNDIVNVSIECLTCCEVIIDVDNPELGEDYVAI